jgi:hypothetical protein
MLATVAPNRQLQQRSAVLREAAHENLTHLEDLLRERIGPRRFGGLSEAVMADGGDPPDLEKAVSRALASNELPLSLDAARSSLNPFRRRIAVLQCE